MLESAIHRSPPDAEQWNRAVNIQDLMDEVLRSGTDESHCFMNEGVIRERLRLFQAHFLPDDPGRKIIYAMKANAFPRIMTIFAEEGIDGFDCASASEIDLALSIDGVGPENIFFNNPVKRKTDIQTAFTRGVRYFVAQSRSGVERVLTGNQSCQANEVEVAARIETQNMKARINLSEKYGCSSSEGLGLLRRIKNVGVRAGLAMHAGSQNRSPESFVRGIKLLGEVAQRADGVSSINVGGGFPVNYMPTDNYDLREYLEAITQAIEETRAEIFKGNQYESRIIIEPGRSLVANAIDLAIPILEIDHHRGKNRVFVNDGVFTSFSDSAIHEWRYNLGVFTEDGRTLSDTVDSFTVYGRTCDSGDILGEYSLPSDMREGDFLWVRNAGAYMDSQASRFNGFGLPRYISYNSYNGRPSAICEQK